jgi:hypothetical protein
MMAACGAAGPGMSGKRRFDGMPFVTLNNINRLEKQAHGWRVHIKRRGREYTQYFPDGWDGPFESLRGAIAWRDETWRTLGPPNHASSKATTRSSSGVLGVTREVQKTASGRIVENSKMLDVLHTHRRLVGAQEPARKPPARFVRRQSVGDD